MEGKGKENFLHLKGRQYKAIPSLTVPRVTSGKRKNRTLGKTVIIKNGPSKRAKYLMRKYFKKWLRKVYGRISPAVARSYYEKRITGRLFYCWKDVWWTESREWKLNIRADCHNRYRLWGRVWNSWRVFVYQKRKSNQLLIKAKKFQTAKLTKCYLLSWRKYVEHERQVAHLKYTALEFSNNLLIKNMFKRWLKSKMCSIAQKERESIAVSHYSHNVLIKYYNSWVYHYKLSCIADNHYNESLSRRCISAWCSYKNRLRHKLINKEKSVSFSNYNVLRTYFMYWRNSFYQSLHVNDQVRHVLMRRILTAWKIYVMYQREQSSKAHVAHGHYIKSLKSKSLKAFSVYRFQQINYKKMSSLATSHNRQRCIGHCWRVWLNRCEHSEDIKLYPLTKLARAHYSIRVYSVYWSKWVQYVSHQKDQMAQRQVALTHYRNTVLPKCIEGLRYNVQLCQYKRHLYLSSIDFRRNILLSQFFYYWWRVTVTECINRDRIDKAISYSDRQVLMHHFKTWRHALHCNVVLMCKAELHCNGYVLKESFTKWKTQTKDFQLKSKGHYNKTLMKCVWSHWRMFIERQKQVKCNKMLAISHWSLVLCNKCIRSWKKYGYINNLKRCKYQLADKYYCKILIRRAVRQWHDNVVFIINRRCQLTTGLIYRHNHLLGKCFNIWREKFNVFNQRLLKVNEQMVKLQQVISKVTLRTAFHSWVMYTSNRTVLKRTYLKAVEFHKSKLSRLYFNIWLNYHQLQLKQKMLAEKGQSFNKVRLVSLCYNQWRIKLMECLVVQEQSVISLWHWSKGLQLKIINKWFEYCKRKKNQRRRYLVAMETYRHELLMRGVSQWIQVASNIKCMRSEIAIKTNIEANSKLWSTVRKCANHWRAMTIRNKTTPTNKATPTIRSDHGATPTNYWEQLVSDYGIPTCNARPKPRCPSFIYNPAEPRPLQPHPLTPPTASNDTFISVTTVESSYYSNKPHPSTLLSPLSWQLLPPSAFKNKQQ